MKKLILIVEDEEALLGILIEEFQREGFTVLFENNGRDGLRTAIKKHPDLILLDIIMPIMDGLTMLSKLRKDVWGNNAKVILLTNLSDPGKVTHAILESVNGFIVKSDWKIKDIIAEVKNKLS